MGRESQVQLVGLRQQQDRRLHSSAAGKPLQYIWASQRPHHDTRSPGIACAGVMIGSTAIICMFLRTSAASNLPRRHARLPGCHLDAFYPVYGWPTLVQEEVGATQQQASPRGQGNIKLAISGWLECVPPPCLRRMCCREAINHMLADCGQFELWRKGEWVTKEDTGYALGESLPMSHCLG